MSLVERCAFVSDDVAACSMWHRSVFLSALHAFERVCSSQNTPGHLQMLNPVPAPPVSTAMSDESHATNGVWVYDTVSAIWLNPWSDTPAGEADCWEHRNSSASGHASSAEMLLPHQGVPCPRYDALSQTCRESGPGMHSNQLVCLCHVPRHARFCQVQAQRSSSHGR